MAFSCSNLERSFGFQRSDCMPLSFFYGKSPFWSPFPLLNKLIISYVRTYSQLAWPVPQPALRLQKNDAYPNSQTGQPHSILTRAVGLHFLPMLIQLISVCD